MKALSQASFAAEYDWHKRTNQPVLVLPFIEGVPTPEKAKLLTSWVKKNADIYANKLVRLYHATDLSLPIEHEGLKPTSATRRRSYQSESGYVYLANTPSRAKTFGDLGNMGHSVVYEVVVPVRHLLADKDQLNNLRSVGWNVGNSIGESIAYGGGVRLKGKIESWAVRKLPDDEFALIEDRNRRIWTFGDLRKCTGVAYSFWEIGSEAIEAAGNDPYAVHWDDVESATITQCIAKQHQDPKNVLDAILKFSPLSVVSNHRLWIENLIQNEADRLRDAEHAACENGSLELDGMKMA